VAFSGYFNRGKNDKGDGQMRCLTDGESKMELSRLYHGIIFIEWFKS